MNAGMHDGWEPDNQNIRRPDGQHGGGVHGAQIYDFLASFDGDAELVRIIVEAFIEGIPRLIRDNKDACMRRDGKVIWLNAYRLNRCGGYLFAESMVSRALNFEVTE